MAGTSEVSREARDVERIPAAGKSKREKSATRDVLAEMQARLSQVEITVGEDRERIDEYDHRMEGLEKEQAQLREDMNGTINVVASDASETVSTLETSLVARINFLEETLVTLAAEMKDMRGDWSLCKMAVTQGVVTPSVATTAAKVKVPEPKAYRGARDAKMIDNFLWSLEQYFRALGITDHARRVDSAPLFLEDTAMVWWRRKSTDIEKGTCTIETWEDFKRELKRQFYPENAEEEARAKLRRLTHSKSIREYVKEFQEVLLEISDYPDREAFFAFCDGLQP